MSLESTLRAMLDEASAMQDATAVRVTRSVLGAIADASAHAPLPKPDGDSSPPGSAATADDETTNGVSTLDESDAVAVVRREIDERGRLASHLAAVSPDHAEGLRREAQVLTIALAQAGH